MRLSDYLREELMLPDLGASDRDGALEAVGAHLVEAGSVSAPEEVVRALIAREDAHTTVLGEGVAVPHATLPHLDGMILLVARSREPLPFGPSEAEPVDLFFVLLSPPGREGEHIKLLARICRLARHPGFLEGLRQAEDGGAMLRTIIQVDAQHV